MTKHFLSLQERFDKHIEMIPDGCWVWMGASYLNGYGVIRINSKSMSAHRIAWKLRNGEIPDGLCVLHRCDNNFCVNHNHLFLGTPKENTEDMIKKGRHKYIPPLGEKQGLSKLKEKDIIPIRKDKRKNSLIAKDYGVSAHAIYSVKENKTWKHIKDHKEG